MSWTPSDHSRKAGSDSEATSPSASIQDFETQQKKFVVSQHHLLWIWVLFLQEIQTVFLDK